MQGRAKKIKGKYWESEIVKLTLLLFGAIVLVVTIIAFTIKPFGEPIIGLWALVVAIGILFVIYGWFGKEESEDEEE